MDYVKKRRESYQDWRPQDSKVKVNDLVKSGFYFIGPEDRVKCYKCHLELHGWQVGDVPADEHRRHSPGCPLVSGTPTSVTIHDTTVADVAKCSEPIYYPGADIPHCMRCRRSPRSVRFFPCSCFVVCQPCAEGLQACPKCNTAIQDKQQFSM